MIRGPAPRTGSEIGANEPEDFGKSDGLNKQCNSSLTFFMFFVYFNAVFGTVKAPRGRSGFAAVTSGNV